MTLSITSNSLHILRKRDRKLGQYMPLAFLSLDQYSTSLHDDFVKYGYRNKIYCLFDITCELNEHVNITNAARLHEGHIHQFSDEGISQ